MGGNDCPPCRGWRAVDFPKLQASPEWKHVGFAFVVEALGASVPPEYFLPDNVKPFKTLLDRASSGGPGSPQAAILVDNEVHVPSRRCDGPGRRMGGRVPTVQVASRRQISSGKADWFNV